MKIERRLTNIELIFNHVNTYYTVTLFRFCNNSSRSSSFSLFSFSACFARAFSIHEFMPICLPREYQNEPAMQITLPTSPMNFILLLNNKTDRISMATCFTLPTTFIIKGPPSLTALKLATFSKKASKPWKRRRRIFFNDALLDKP